MKEIAKTHTYYFLKLTYLVRYFADAFFYVFIFVYLGSLGFNTGQIGLISAFIPLAALLGNILFKYLAIDVNKNRTLLLIITVFEFSVALLFAVYQSSSFAYYLVFITFASIFNVPALSLLDGYSGTYIVKEKKQYSSMRIMGTLSYVIAPLLGAFLMEQNIVTYSTLFYLSAALFLVSFVLFFLLPKSEVVANAETDEKFRILEHHGFIIYLLFTFFVVTIAHATDNFFALYLTKERGISESIFGYLTAATIFVEFLVFIFIIYKKNMFKNPTFSFVLVGLTMLGRPLAIALGLPDNVLFAFALLRGVAWGYLLVFNVLYIARTVPVAQLTGALFSAAIVLTIGRIITSLILGQVLKHFTYEYVFSFVSGLMILSISILTTLSYIHQKKQRTLIKNPQ